MSLWNWFQFNKIDSVIFIQHFLRLNDVTSQIMAT
jgi:hypothetical protein